MIRVLLAEDMHLLRGALVALLRLEPDMRVVAEVSSGAAIVSTAVEHRPDIAVLDVQLPEVDGITAAGEVIERLPDCRVLIVTQHARPELLRRAMAAKVHGFMLKDAPPHELTDAIRGVAAGRTVIDPALAATTITARENPLAPRELDVLRLMAEGDEPSEIAGKLHLTKGTVRNYLSAIVTKLDARNRLDAVRIATDAGWL